MKNKAEKQVYFLNIKNDWNGEIIFKMKSTQPSVLSFRPVYGSIAPGTKVLILLLKLVYFQKRIKIYRKGLLELPKLFTKTNMPRLTILIAPTSVDNKNIENVWREKQNEVVYT